VFSASTGKRMSLGSAQEYITVASPPMYGPVGGSKATPSFAGGSSHAAIQKSLLLLLMSSEFLNCLQ